MKNNFKQIILFDLYQTLIDIDINEKNKIINQAKGWKKFAKLLKPYGITITSTKLYDLHEKQKEKFYIGKNKKTRHSNFCQLMDLVFKKNLKIKISCQKICQLIYEYRKIARGHIRLYPNVSKTLKQLSKKYILAIASYTQKCFADFELQEMNIKKYFTYFIYTSEISFYKNSPQFYKQCLKIINTNIKNCIMIGDNYDTDVLWPQKLGFKTIWIQNPLTMPENTHSLKPKPTNTMKIKEFAKLPQIIEQILN